MNIFKRSKWLYSLLGLLLLGGTAFGQNYASGPMGVYGALYNAATTIPTGGQVLVSNNGTTSIGNWWFGGITANRAGTGTLTFDGTGTFSNALAASYTNGAVSRTGSSADFTFPTGDAGATAGSVYHPLSISAASAALNASVIYNASSTTPNPTLLAAGVIGVDPIANWGFTSMAATGTVTLSTRDEMGVLTGNIYVAGYNTSTNKWEKVGTSTAIVAGGQTLVSTAGIALATYGAFSVGSEAPPAILVSPKVFLQGAMSGTVMTTTIQANVPLSQPYNYSPFSYAGTETMASRPATLVDWVMVELKSAASPYTLIATRAALLLSNGSVTDVDGVSPVSFPGQAAGSYTIGIRHRNHLPVRTLAAVALSATTTTVDFTANANVYQNPAVTTNAAEVNTSGAIYAMWAGDANANGAVRYQGPSNDLAYILGTVLGSNPLGNLSGQYSPGDVNMNGVVRYQGPSNDPAFILSSVLGSNPLKIVSQHY